MTVAIAAPSMPQSISSTLARPAVRQAFGAPREEQWGELCFTDRAGKQLPLGTYYRFTR